MTICGCSRVSASHLPQVLVTVHFSPHQPVFLPSQCLNIFWPGALWQHSYHPFRAEPNPSPLNRYRLDSGSSTHCSDGSCLPHARRTGYTNTAALFFASAHCCSPQCRESFIQPLVRAPGQPTGPGTATLFWSCLTYCEYCLQTHLVRP